MIRTIAGIKDGEYDIIHKYGAGIEKILLGMRNFKKTRTVASLNGIAHACWNYKNYSRKDPRCCKFPKKIKCIYSKNGPIAKKRFPINFLSFFYFPLELARHYVKKIDKFLAVSKAMKKLHEKAEFDPEKIELAYNAYDPELKKHIDNHKVEKNPEKIRILYLGRIDEKKGVEDLIRAFNKIKKENTELNIVGDGNNRQNLKEKYGNDPQINFVGKVEYNSNEMVKQYKKANIFVHPARYPEPSGRALTEAGISHCAIIASNKGGPPEMIRNRGQLFKPGNVDDLAKKLNKLVTNRKLQKQAAEKCFKYFSKYTPERTIDNIEKEYKKLLKK